MVSSGGAKKLKQKEVVMTKGEKLKEAVVEAGRQVCPACGHNRFEETSTVYETASDLPVEADGTVEYDYANYETGETCDSGLYFQCSECNIGLIMGDDDKLEIIPDECFAGSAESAATCLGNMINLVSKAERQRRYLADRIANIDETLDGVTMLSKHCFTIRSGNLELEASLSPEYYNFKLQFKAIEQLILESRIDNVAKNLRAALESGKIKTGTIDVKLHREVVRIIKCNLGG
jgi:uncharacterized Zn finger protein (UPF0148 family)